MEKFRLLLLLLFLSVTTFTYGQNVSFEHLTDKEGLVNTNVTCVFKDSYGYLWTGTFNGLSRYDGYSFTNYLNDHDNDSSLTDNSIRFIFETREKVMIIGLTFAGLCIYNRETDSFVRFRHDLNNPGSLSSDYVLNILEDRKGNIWVGSRGGLDRFDIKSGKFIHYDPQWNNKGFVSGIAEDAGGNLWLYGRGSDLCRFNPVRNTSESIRFTDNSNLSFTRGGTLLLDRMGNLWIGRETVGLFRFNPRNGKTDFYSAENKTLQSNIIFSLMEDSEGKIWIGTDGGGAYRYSHETNRFERFEHEENDETTLSGNGVYCVYESEPGVICIGAYAGGLNIYKKHKQKFLKYTTTGEPGHRLSHRTILSMAESRDGKIWLGTDGGGLNLFDPVAGTFKYYNTKNSIIHSDIIKTVCVDHEDNLWLGSYGKGLCKVNFDKGQVRVFRGDMKSKGKTILGDHAWTIAESFDHKIWVGLLSFGIQVYDPATDAFSYYQFDSTAFKNEVSSVHILYQDSKHRMWVGVENYGLGYFDPQKKIFVRIKSETGKPGMLGSNTIRDIFEDSQGNIWVAGFMGGLNKLVDEEKGQFEVYTTKDGLPTNNIYNILEDDHQNLWLSSDQGISLFNIKEKKFTNFTLEDGLQSAEFSFQSALKTRSGHMIFGGIQGFNIFHPDSIYYNLTPPRVVLTDFKIFDKSIKPGKIYDDRRYLSKVINMTGNITLRYTDNIFSVEFAALDFTSPAKNKYAYRLRGFNDQWTYVNAGKRFATYTNLDPGEYTFQVIASNNDGVWNKTGVSLKITILPPWWMTWWFRGLTLALTLLLAVAFYYARMRSIREKNKSLEQEVKKRTAEIMQQQEEIIEQKNQLEKKKQELEHLNKTKDKFFSIIGHDLKGPVRALTSLTGLLKEEAAHMNTEKQRMLTNHIDTSSHKIQQLVLNLLEWAHTQSRQVQTNPVPISAPALFRENIELLAEQAAQKQIRINMKSEEQHVVNGDFNMVCTVVRNILSNSIKYTPRGGSIQLTSSITENDEIRLSITDSGIGMSEEVLSKLFSLEKSVSVKGTDNETGTGLGMIIAKEFVELNKGKIYAESAIGKGSTFYIILPRAPQP